MKMFIEKKCELCGKKFSPTIGWQKYCGCQMVKCKRCNKKYNALSRYANNDYCSHKCFLKFVDKARGGYSNQHFAHIKNLANNIQ